jgi:cell division protein FtsL
MEFQNLIDIAFAVFGSLAGWVLKTMWEAIRDLKNDLKDLDHHIGEKYVRKEDFKDALADIKSTLERIIDKLDAKADK